jgi:aminoglycoside phosphotransferase (APT) family kinase protein
MGSGSGGATAADVPGVVMSTASLRIRQVMALAGLTADGPLQRIESARNEVWIVGEHVVRIASNLGSHRLAQEAQVISMLPPEVPHPGVIRSGRAAFGEWTVLPRIHAHTLAHAWLELNEAQKYGAILALGRALAAVHQVDASMLRPAFLAPGSLECSHQLPQARLMAVIERLRADRRVDRALVSEAAVLAEQADAIMGPMPSTLIHGDFHLENVLFGEGMVQAVVDFEFARAGWPEVDLEVLLRFCDEPQLHVVSSDATRVSRDDFKKVAGWMRAGYPELFAHPRLVERVNMCSLSYDLRDLAMFPPDRPARELPSFHPLHRVRRLLDGRGLLNIVDW